MTPLASHTLLTTALVGALLPPDVPEGHMWRAVQLAPMADTLLRGNRNGKNDCGCSCPSRR